MHDDDPFGLGKLFLPPDMLAQERWAVVPRRIQRRRQHHIQMPWRWYEKLAGADGQTYRVALYLLYLHWKGRGEPIKLANGMMARDGVPRESKRRALHDLERRGLITVEWRDRKSPIVKVPAP